jgi:hypothetical protein
VIVRIATEGQYEFPDSDTDRLNELDNEVVAAVEAGDEEKFQTAFASTGRPSPTTCSRSPT